MPDGPILKLPEVPWTQSPSVFDSALTRAMRTITDLLGGNDPNSIMGIVGTLDVPGGAGALQRAVSGLLKRARSSAETVRAGDVVEGLRVRPDVPNEGSIGASLNDYDVVDGLHVASIDDFQDTSPPKFYSASEEARTKALAEAIRQNKEIAPLIVVDDGQQFPYVLEGGHRFDALKMLGVKKFPVKVVEDLDP